MFDFFKTKPKVPRAITLGKGEIIVNMKNGTVHRLSVIGSYHDWGDYSWVDTARQKFQSFVRLSGQDGVARITEDHYEPMCNVDSIKFNETEPNYSIAVVE